jgi:transposase
MKFIGLDAHSRNSFFVVLGKNGKLLRRKKVSSQEDTILEFVRSVKGAKKLVFEEGVMSQWLYLLLKDEVDELVVCKPSENESAKTDWIDAAENADLLRVGRLKSVFHTDDVLMNLRVLVSGYCDVTAEITRTKNRYKALYREIALPTNGSGFYQAEELLSKLDTAQRQYVGTTLFEQLRLLEEQRCGYIERFKENARAYSPIQLLMSIPGIGLIQANKIVAVIVTPYRFPRKYNLFSYAKLSNHKKISDGKQYGKKRPRGQPILKDVFKTAALSAIRGDNAFRRRYDELRAQGKDDRKSRSIIAKLIAATVLGVWKSGKPYNDKQMEVTRRLSNKSCHSGA